MTDIADLLRYAALGGCRVGGKILYCRRCRKRRLHAQNFGWRWACRTCKKENRS